MNSRSPRPAINRRQRFKVNGFGRRRRGGFTLIEILVATVATAILLVGLHGVFSRGMRLRDQATARLQEVRLRERAERLLRDDLRHALVTGARLAASLEGSEDSGRSRFPGYLRLTTATAPTARTAFHGDLQEVEYYISEDPWATNGQAGALVRTIDRNLLAPVRETSREDIILRGVGLMEVRFFDGNNWLQSWEYVDSESMLPEAVEVILRPAAAPGRSGEIAPLVHLLVPWTVQALGTNSVASGSASGESAPENGPGPGGEGPPGGGER